MSLNTNLNQAPYFDDFNETKNFHGILFKPSVAVQARELNQMQSILRNQIERFGNNILKQGTIIDGCGFKFNAKLPFVKILDLRVDGQPVNVSEFMGMTIEGVTTGVRAIVVNYADGLQSQAPDLNTIYVQYISSGTNDEKIFSSTENLKVITPSGLEVTMITGAGLIDGGALGEAYAITVQPGIIYQNGAFVRVDIQQLVVTKYHAAPDKICVGFKTNETIINSNSDTSLLDNANGSENENAPGADRLKLTPALIALTKADAEADDEFLPLIEYEAGNPVIMKTRTQYNVIGDEMASRTSEESGDYTVKKFHISIDTHRTEPEDKVSVAIGPGLAYIEGQRVETLSNMRIDMNQSTQSALATSQDIATNLGQYLLVNEYAGDINPAGSSVELYDAPLGAVTAGAVPGSVSDDLIATATVKSIEYDGGTPGTADATYRIYLYNISVESGKMLSQAKSIYFDGTDKGAADIVLVSGLAKLQDTALRTPIYGIGRNAAKTLINSDFYHRHRITAQVSTGGSMTLTISGDVFGYGVGTLSTQQKRDIILICNQTNSPHVKGDIIDLSGASVVASGGGETLTINGIAAPATAMNVIVYLTVKKVNARPAQKLTRDIYVKLDMSSAALTGPWSLGVPDAVQILGIWKGNTYSESNEDVIRSFKLNKNSDDTFYGLSFLTMNSGVSLISSDRVLVKVRVFQKDTTLGDGFFSVDSYVGLTPKEIPNYGEFDLRDVLDFRPWPTATAAYALTAGAATVNPANTLSFTSANGFVPKSGEFFETDYEYYLGRQDRLVVRSNGTFALIEGIPSVNPILPNEPDDCMTLATFIVPPFESLPTAIAAQYRKNGYAILMSSVDNKGYKMRDIAAIENRIRKLEYYTALNSLESETASMVVQDGNGLDRFKNGIFVDPMNDLTIADVTNLEYRAGFNPSDGDVTPMFSVFNLPLRLTNTGSGATSTDDLSTLAYTEVEFQSQPNATRTRNCVENFYRYNGTAYVFPEYDDGVDVTRTPKMNIDMNLEQVLTDYTESLGNIIPLRTVDTKKKSTSKSKVIGRKTTSTTVGPVTTNNTKVTTQTTKTTDIKKTVVEMVKSGVKTTTQNVGDFITDFTFEPFMKSQPLKVAITGLRPNTLHHFFFDNVKVDASVAPGRMPADAIQSAASVTRIGQFGDANPSGIKSNAAGELYAVFMIPEGQFFVGDRSLLVIDVNTLNDLDSATSKAEFIYRAFNFSIDKTGLSVTTRTPQFTNKTTVKESSTTSVTKSSKVFTTTEVDPLLVASDDGGDDPIAETFFVDAAFAPNNSTLYLTSLDLFFASKALSTGVTVMIREVENGVPTSAIVPFGSKHLKASEVSVSTDGSVPTNVVFDNLVALSVGVEYCVVAKPDGNSPEYTIFISKVGQNNLLSGTPVTSDWGRGALLTSTNNRTWIPYAGEHMKFTLYIAQFQGAGEVTMSNDAMEFVRIENYTGGFQIGETIFVERTALTGTVTTTLGSDQIVGSSTTFLADYTVGGHIVIGTGVNRNVYQVKAIATNTTMTIQQGAYSAVAGAPHHSTIVGTVAFVNYDDPRVYIAESSAVLGNILVAGDTIIGEQSNASCDIDEIYNLPVSYIQPHIYKTITANNSIDLSVVTSRANGTTSEDPLMFGEDMQMTQETVIFSRSNEITGGLGKSLRVKANLSTSANKGTPVLDHAISGIDVYTFQMNNLVTGETGNEGIAKAKYISRTVELAPDMDAEDLQVYLTAYRPSGSDIKVYAKLAHGADPAPFTSKVWSELTLDATSQVYSTTSNFYDYKELKFTLPSTTAEANAATFDGSEFRYEDENGAIYDNFKVFAIKIVMLSDQEHIIPRIRDVRALALAA